MIFSEIESTGDRSPLQQKNDLPSTEEVFTELISQRLAQGFQVIFNFTKKIINFCYFFFREIKNNIALISRFFSIYEIRNF